MDKQVKEALVKIGMARFFKTAAPVAAAEAGVGKWLRGAGEHPMELAGLGVLAAPSVAHLAGHPMEEKTKSKLEVAGLGTLAAPSLAHMLKRH
jgi:hypothetical protein